MRKKLKNSKRRMHWIEQLEARQLLSGTTPLATLSSSSGSTQVQALLAPTYHLFTPAGSLSPLQTSGPQGYTPAELRAAYGLSQVTFGAVTGNGTGQTIAIIDAYNDPTIQSDLHAFDAAFGLANTTLRVVSQTGSTTLPPWIRPVPGR